jgi:hypothetical protein
MIPDSGLVAFRNWLSITPEARRSGEAFAKYWHARNSSGVRDAAPAKPERRMVVRALKRPAPSRPVKNRRRDPTPAVFAYDGPPRAIPFPRRTAVGSVDFDVVVFGKGMGCDGRTGRDLKFGGRDGEMPTVERGQQGHEVGPETWETTRGRDRRGRDADPTPQREVETTDGDYNEEGYPSGRAPPHGPFDMPGEEQEEGMEPCERRDVPLGLDPPVSEAQRRAAWAAVGGHSNLGISPEAGKKILGKAEDDDEEQDRELRALLLRHLDEDDERFEHAFALARRALRRGNQGGPIPFKGMPEGFTGKRDAPLAGDAARSFADMYPGAPPPRTLTGTKVFVR